MTCITTISINNDFATCETSIALRTANNETACRIDKIFSLPIEQLARYNRKNYLFPNVPLNLFQCNIFSVLSRYYNGIHTFGFSVHIFNRNLGLPIRTKIIKSTILTHF
ncbi:hypothetical protein D3C78_1672000 [compost metagenome]